MGVSGAATASIGAIGLPITSTTAQPCTHAGDDHLDFMELAKGCLARHRACGRRLTAPCTSSLASTSRHVVERCGKDDAHCTPAGAHARDVCTIDIHGYGVQFPSALLMTDASSGDCSEVEGGSWALAELASFYEELPVPPLGLHFVGSRAKGLL